MRNIFLFFLISCSGGNAIPTGVDFLEEGTSIKVHFETPRVTATSTLPSEEIYFLAETVDQENSVTQEILSGVVTDVVEQDNDSDLGEEQVSDSAPSIPVNDIEDTIEVVDGGESDLDQNFPDWLVVVMGERALCYKFNNNFYHFKLALSKNESCSKRWKEVNEGVGDEYLSHSEIDHSKAGHKLHFKIWKNRI